jgi:hypothetical protein
METLIEDLSDTPTSDNETADISSADIRRIEALNRGNVSIRPTNATIPGTDNLTREDGSIILGANSTNSRCSSVLSENQNRAEAIRSAVISRIRSSNS